MADGENLLDIIETQNEIAAGGLDLQGVMELVAARALKLTNAGGALVEMADGSDTVYEVGAGMGQKHIGERSPMEGSLSGLSIRTNKVLSSDNTDSDERIDPRIGLTIGAGSMIVVPLVHAGAAVGTLTVFAPAIYHFRSRDVETMRLLGGLISAHIAQAGDFRSGASSRTDELTGIGNRRAYEEALAAELSRSRRGDGIVSLIVFDVGEASDDAIRQVAAILDNGRGSDAAFRLEGGEFAMILPETDADGARAAGTRISSRVAETVLGGGQVAWGSASGESDPERLHAGAVQRLSESRARA